MRYITDSGNGNYLIKKGFTYAITGLIILMFGASWSFTWGIASDRQITVTTLETHVKNGFVHNMQDNHITKEDLKLYFAPMMLQIKNIEEDVREIKNTHR